MTLSFYQTPSVLREEALAPPTERQMQAIWFEQWLTSPLQTDSGHSLEIVQPGFWNHGGGPDFQQAAIRFPQTGELRVGPVELHLRAQDWEAHGHGLDPLYDATILHVIWEPTAQPYYPATREYRQIPQLVLSTQLLAPWSLLQNVASEAARGPLPEAHPGRCQAALAGIGAEEMLELVRQAGLHRLRQRALRWAWRQRLTSPEQTLFEALAEALGYHANQIPMRLVAQRLPWAKLRAMDSAARQAHLFGLAGFLPDDNVSKFAPEVRQWLKPLWEIWWKARGELDYALLPRSQWKLAGLRPLNRPERRLAALSQLVPIIPKLRKALEKRDAETFAVGLLQVRDPFWEHRSTLSSTAHHEPVRLIGEERVRDILTNFFWPYIALEEPDLARKALTDLQVSDNRQARRAAQRVLIELLPGKHRKEALVQQGLLQILRDYCLTDCSNCARCTFPELIRARSINAAGDHPL